MEDPTLAVFAQMPQMRRLFHIGHICAQWADVEYTFACAIWHMLGLDDETGKIVTGGLDMLPRANMAINLSNHQKQDSRFTKALKEARAAIQDGLDTKRNRAVHGVHFFDANLNLYVEVHRGKGGRDRTELTEEDLNEIGRTLFKVGQDLRTKLTEFIPNLPSKTAVTTAKTA